LAPPLLTRTDDAGDARRFIDANHRGLTDAEIAEAHRSADVFAEVQEMTAPLNALLSLLHALDWLELNNRKNRIILAAFFTGVYGDPVQIAMGKLDPLAKHYPSEKTRTEAISFANMLKNIRELIAEQRFLNWQVAFPGVWSDWENATLTGGFDAIIANPPWTGSSCSKSSGYRPASPNRHGPARGRPREDDYGITKSRRSARRSVF